MSSQPQTPYAWYDVPPAGIKGVHEGPLTGQPTSESDAKLWSLLAQLSVVVGAVFGAGYLGWLGPLIIFLVFKDRNRYVRYNAAEALNAAIAVLVINVAIFILATIITIVTLGIGGFLYVLIGVPAIVQIVFAIVGAVKTQSGEWWNYPVNIRFIK
jgi:uncharacterized Tic20 family protein